jgi:type II secretory pathway component PulM
VTALILAQAVHEGARRSDSSFLIGQVAFLVIFIFLVSVVWVLRSYRKNLNAKIDQQTEQLARIEEQLRRIANALERGPGN